MLLVYFRFRNCVSVHCKGDCHCVVLLWELVDADTVIQINYTCWTHRNCWNIDWIFDYTWKKNHVFVDCNSCNCLWNRFSVWVEMLAWVRLLRIDKFTCSYICQLGPAHMVRCLCINISGLCFFLKVSLIFCFPRCTMLAYVERIHTTNEGRKSMASHTILCPSFLVSEML